MNVESEIKGRGLTRPFSAMEELKMIKLKTIAAAAVSAVLAVSVPCCVSAESAGINVEYRTAAEIAEYMKSHPFDYSVSEYDEVPDYANAPYSAGKLSGKTLQNALNALNTMRFIAGVDEVTLSDKYNELAQAGTLVNAVNDELSHSPEQPAGMSDELYQLGLSGTSSSNIGWNYHSLARNVVYGWMSDKSTSNISRVGHRRWCINPTMQKTGFGNVGEYYAMYSFDRSGSSGKYGVCWPAQVMPAEFFADADPWSISMGKAVNISAVEVTLTRKSDGKKWTFSQAYSDGYFNVNNDGYGQKGCIIFRPEDVSYKDGDSFDVKITGLDEDVSYTVDFVDVFAPEVTEATLSELTNFILSRRYTADEVTDLDENDKINVFDAVLARRSLLK